MYLRLPKSFATIFGSFTLGLYVAIQGPTLMDLIDLLHVNNDFMSYSLAFSSLAYSVGGLLSGLLFNYVDRQILMSVFYVIFGLSNIVTPFISSYLVYSVISMLKMLCAGGTDCASNVWILEMWPGKDAWLQALHFLFAVGCALGPLIVEPFLSSEYKENENVAEKMAGKTSGTLTINDQNNESRIYIPYGASGTFSIMAGCIIYYLYILERRIRLKEAEHQGLKQIPGEQILLTSTNHQIHPMALEAGARSLTALKEEIEPEVGMDSHKSAMLEAVEEVASMATPKRPPEMSTLSETAVFQPNTTNTVTTNSYITVPPTSALSDMKTTPSRASTPTPSSQQIAILSASQQLCPMELQAFQPPEKITSKAREQLVGRPPYYVMFAIGLCALCLSFYCGIEISSMNYLATFAINIDLQLTKSTAALMSSALTISFAVGRGFGIWIAAHMSPQGLFYLCAGLMMCGNLSMLIFANTAELMLWFSICLFGIGCGPMFPAIVSFYDDKISRVTNIVSGIFILGSMFNVALNTLIIGHHIIDNALILIVCNLVGSVLLLLLFGTLHLLTKVKKSQRVKKYKLRQQSLVAETWKQREQQQLAMHKEQQQAKQIEADNSSGPMQRNDNADQLESQEKQSQVVTPTIPQQSPSQNAQKQATDNSSQKDRSSELANTTKPI